MLPVLNDYHKKCTWNTTTPDFFNEVNETLDLNCAKNILIEINKSIFIFYYLNFKMLTNVEKLVIVFQNTYTCKNKNNFLENN